MIRLIHFYGDNASLLAHKTLVHLGIAALALAAAVAIALPLGIWLGHRHRGSLLAINLSNVLRALPTLAIVALALAFFGINLVNMVIALAVLAIPPILTNAYTAVDGVDADAVEAARGMGMRGRQVLLGVELPLAWPLIFAGLRTGAVYIIATVPVAAVAGSAGGLGDIILNQPAYGLVGVIAAAILVTVLAFAVDGALALVQRAVTPRGVSAPRELHTIVPSADVAAEATLSHT
jgi:osmoprotectant transport system permease protein